MGVAPCPPTSHTPGLIFLGARLSAGITQAMSAQMAPESKMTAAAPCKFLALNHRGSFQNQMRGLRKVQVGREFRKTRGKNFISKKCQEQIIFH